MKTASKGVAHASKQVLSEVAHPHRIFARTTIITVAGVGVLFFLINVVYVRASRNGIAKDTG